MKAILSSILFASLVVCSGLAAPKSPLVSESREVRAITDEKKSVTVVEGMVWYDAKPATKGIRFPAGTYVLEAEDDEYWYFKSATPIEMRIFKNGEMVDGRDMTGGIMIAKAWLKMVPAAGYIDDEGSKKMMIWKLGRDFVRREGKDWTKTF